ncbi:hypothetical protein K435DRAFT_870213 [Dendrothele bispora CBS 962.96]|uniref:Uncharacterized protein n=1 Tax=Dendrothele bispora (strain CBS 962.96) TaxID=1314807 RepID=A0A4V4HCS5_DENBC|nr:hypothetical protein K435DRAFT_870213 [Dendrothele bispora CBS 962.96]
MADVDVEEPATTEELITTSSVTTTPAPVSRKRIRADTESPEPAIYKFCRAHSVQFCRSSLMQHVV